MRNALPLSALLAKDVAVQHAILLLTHLILPQPPSQLGGLEMPRARADLKAAGTVSRALAVARHLAVLEDTAEQTVAYYTINTVLNQVEGVLQNLRWCGDGRQRLVQGLTRICQNGCTVGTKTDPSVILGRPYDSLHYTV
jgi:hypothetical protein